MSISCRYAEDLENLVLCILENGTTADEVKGIVDDCVEIMQNAANEAAENSRSKRETSVGQTNPKASVAASPELLPTQPEPISKHPLSPEIPSTQLDTDRAKE